MTFTVALQVSITTPNGIEERVSVPTQELTPALIIEIKEKVSDLIGGENQIADADVITVSGEITSDAGGILSVQNATFTKEEATTFGNFIESVLNPPQ